MQYQEFSLRLDPAPGGGFTARVGDWKSGQASGPVGLDLDPEALRQLGAGFEHGLFADPEELRRLGSRLWEAVFSPAIRERFFESKGQAGAGRLRIRLQMALDSPASIQLHALPWEALFRQDLEVFVGDDPRTVVVRSPELPAAGERPPVATPLRILAVAAQAAGKPSLDLAGELAQLRKAAGFWRKAKVASLPRGDLGSLREALLEGSFHVLHFMGHGDVDPVSGRGCLWLEDGAGGSTRLFGDDLAVQLRGIPSLRLVFLNACRTASAAAAAPFASVAAALLQAEIPAVVAMQAPLSDRAALAFSRTFYRHLARRDPLETALAEGRLAIRGECPESGEWATPVLFLRAADGRILAPPSPRRGAWLLAASVAVLALSYLGGKTLFHPPAAAPKSVPALPVSAPASPPETAPAPKVVPPKTGPNPTPSSKIDSAILGRSSLVPAPIRSTNRTETVHEGVPIWIEPWKAHLSIKIQDGDLFPDLAQNPFLTVALQPVDGDMQPRSAPVAPFTVEFMLKRKTVRVQVMDIDWKARTARLSWVETR
jgi:hypothetical protein